MAQYPNTVPIFSTKHNITDIVDEGHPNSVQDEVIAIAQELGVSPRNSAALATVYATVDARLEWIEANYRQLTNHDSHALQTGLLADDHTQYIKVDGSRALTGSTAVTAAPVAVQAGDTQSQGVLHTLSRSDHRHAVAAATVPGNSAVADTASLGASAAFARADHRHGREGFGTVTAATTYGIAAGSGAALTLARSDHTHGTPALTATAPSTQIMSDAAVVGTATDPARADHKHALPGYGLVAEIVDESVPGLAKAAGVLNKVARADHSHGSLSNVAVTGPIGVIVAFGADAAPSGWLLCNGALVSTTTYAALFAVIGHRWNGGADPGGGNFKLPPLNDANRVLRGATAAGGIASQTHTHASTAISGAGTSHTHSGSSGGESGHNHNVNGTTGDPSLNHTHGFSATSGGTGNHVHYVGEPTSNHAHVGVASGGATTAGQDVGHTHGVGIDNPSGHNHSVSGTTGTVSSWHTHSMNFTSGTGSSHSHTVSVGSEAAHTHAITPTNVAAQALPTADVTYIIKT